MSDIQSFAEKLGRKKEDAISIATELREIATELNKLADNLESGSNLPRKVFATSEAERLRRMLSKYNALKQEIDFLVFAIRGWRK